LFFAFVCCIFKEEKVERNKNVGVVGRHEGVEEEKRWKIILILVSLMIKAR